MINPKIAKTTYDSAFESDVVSDSDKSLQILKSHFGLFESDVVSDSDKSLIGAETAATFV